MEVFMDHSNRSTAINNQLKKPRSSHGKPEWQKTAIRTCGHWSEQLSSKGKIYFYNCMTEVSQWQKPPEWCLSDISRKDVLKIQNDKRNIEEHSAKRSHQNFELFENHKRMKMNSLETRKPTSSQPEPISNHIKYPINSLFNNIKLDNQNNNRFLIDHDHCKKLKINNPCMRTNDDMDISPNSSPLSDSCSNACSNSKSQSPQRHLAPTPYSFQKPFICNSRPPSTNCHDILSKTDKASSTLCQLVDAIRASIDGFLDQSPKSTLQLVDRVYPLMNGTYSTKSGELTKSNPSITSVVDSRLLKNHEHLQISSNKINSPDLLHNHMHSRERNSNSLHSDHNSSCTYSPKLSNSTVINIRANSKVNPVLDFPKPSVTHCPSLARPSTMTIDQRRVLTGVTRSTLQNNSPTIISPLNSSTTTSSNISVPFQTSSQACVVSSHQMNDLLDILAHKDPQYVRNRIEEKSPKTYLISNNHCTQNSRENASPETDFRGVHTHTSASHDPTSNRQANDAGSAGARSQNTQLNDLVQVLKVALQQTNQSQSSASSSSRTFNSRVAVPPLHEILRTPSVDQKHRLYKESSISSKDYFHKQQSIIGSQNRFGSVDNCQPNSDPILLDTLKSPISERINTHDNTNIVGNVGIHSAPNYPIVSPTSNSPPVIGTSDSVMMMKKRSPSVQQEKVDVDVEILSISLDSSEMRAYCEPMLTLKYYDDSLQRLEQEAHMEAKNFDRLQSVLYAELSAESKKLRALVRISEAKLAIHKEKQSALQELMDAIEVRKHLPNLSFVDDVL